MRRQSGAGTLATLVLTCVFGMTMLLSLATGAMIYRRVADRVDRSAQERVGLTYITAKVHSYDAAGTVEAGRFDGLDAVYLYQDLEGSVYQTILYVYDGWLRELYCEQGLELAPQDGLTVAQAQALTVEQPEAGLLVLRYTTGQGLTETAGICLRSGGVNRE